MFSWKRPRDLGVRNGRLAPCRRSPNCVSSQADPADRVHHVAPILYAGSMDAVRDAIAALPLATLVRVEDNYLHAEFRTPVLRFVDDVELWLDNGLLHVRSASRLGRRDFGTNRRRVERLRALVATLG